MFAAVEPFSAVLSTTRPPPTSWHLRHAATGLRQPGRLVLRNTVLSRASAGEGPINWQQLNAWYDARRQEEKDEARKKEEEEEARMRAETEARKKAAARGTPAGPLEAPSRSLEDQRALEEQMERTTRRCEQMEAEVQTSLRVAYVPLLLLAAFFNAAGPAEMAFFWLVLFCCAVWGAEVTLRKWS